jgi:hypothetical protein
VAPDAPGVRLRGYIDSHLDSYRHTLHCQRVLLTDNMGARPMKTVNVVAELKYPECKQVGMEGKGGYGRLTSDWI